MRSEPPVQSCQPRTHTATTEGACGAARPHTVKPRATSLAARLGRVLLGPGPPEPKLNGAVAVVGKALRAASVELTITDRLGTFTARFPEGYDSRKNREGVATDSLPLRAQDGTEGSLIIRRYLRQSTLNAETSYWKMLPEVGSLFQTYLASVARERELERSLQELSVLYDISRIVEGGSAPEDTFPTILETIHRAVDYEDCTLFVAEAQRENAVRQLVPVATKGRLVDLIGGVRFRLGRGLSAWVAQERQPVLISNLRPNGRFDGPDLDGSALRSFASVPLVVENEIVGALNLGYSVPNAFTEGDLRLLSIIASQTAATIRELSLHRQLERLALTDGLTRVYNRRYFFARLREEMARAARTKGNVTLLILDVDDFKAVNDRYGHAAGDRVLSGLSRGLAHHLRGCDVLARYGGEEFAVLLPDTGLTRALGLAERLRTVASRSPLRCRAEQPVALTVSIGVACYPQHASTGESLLAAADAALYRAKRSGKNRTCSPDSELEGTERGT